MKAFPLPLRAIGPGSQPAEDSPVVLDVPRDVALFEMPRVPERADPAHLAAAREVLAGWLDALQRWEPEVERHGPRCEITEVPAPVRAVLNDVLGEGEVAIRISGAPELRIQESVFGGFWRCLRLGTDGAPEREWLEAGPVPEVVLERAHAAARDGLPAVEIPAAAMNSPALLAELAARLGRFDRAEPAGVINLTLLPVSPLDHDVLAAALPVGPVAMISRGFGNCHVSSTGTRHVWRVQFFNSMQTLILNTLEVVELPAAAVAAPEDLCDSRERLAELVRWMAEVE